MYRLRLRAPAGRWRALTKHPIMLPRAYESVRFMASEPTTDAQKQMPSSPIDERILDRKKRIEGKKASKATKWEAKGEATEEASTPPPVPSGGAAEATKQTTNAVAPTPTRRGVSADLAQKLRNNPWKLPASFWSQHQRVFLVFRPFFHRNRTPERSRKAFYLLYKKYEPLFQHLTGEYTLDNLWELVSEYRRRKGFESAEAAAMLCPDLDHPLPEPPTIKELDEALTSGDCKYMEDVAAMTPHEIAEHSRQMAHEIEVQDAENVPEEGILDRKSLLISYRAQHVILTNVQTILEHICFDFLKEFAPEYIAKMEWDTVEMAELDISAGHMLQAFGVLKSRAGLAMGSREWGHLMNTCVRVRNHAVHRDPVGDVTLKDWIQTAVRFAEALGEYERADQLESVLIEVGVRTKKAKKAKRMLTIELKTGLKELARKRRELDQQEREMMDGMYARDTTARDNISNELRDSLLRVFAGKYSVTTHRDASARREKARREEARRLEEQLRAEQELEDQKEQEQPQEEEEEEEAEEEKEDEEGDEDQKEMLLQERGGLEEAEELYQPNKSQEQEDKGQAIKEAGIDDGERPAQEVNWRELVDNVDLRSPQPEGETLSGLGAVPHSHGTDLGPAAVVLRTGKFALLPTHDDGTSTRTAAELAPKAVAPSVHSDPLPDESTSTERAEAKPEEKSRLKSFFNRWRFPFT
ncbi:ubiquinol-cytochrome-c reductase cytochrome c1 [Diplodia corticola]|uniref:Ubiquinol-cytochrome-c reductase cytochrome c1 n=1 Tax=Diplodia corticola TaxID=236234 RepID=A0A1J9QQN4_9PEZI|nr:ubiquinol-cytochrome-c reductase cytochrome c1 [Diplodia corticola]OJD30761.1 ubiquinol-cytochrome-c reductase cytochrome c1 [Diplodia corticola]